MREYNTLAALAKAAKQISKTNLTRLFAVDPSRIDSFHFSASGLHFDFSRQKINCHILETLSQFAEDQGVPDFLNQMNQGQVVNPSEQLAARHMDWRKPDEQVSSNIIQTRKQIERFQDQLSAGQITGVSGQPITHIVHIGIGGSDLGPRLVYTALNDVINPDIQLRFVANVDAAEINDALKGLDPATTLVFVVSKSFTTEETLANATLARDWLDQHLGTKAIAKQMYAVTACFEQATAFGISSEQIFEFSNGVGGRFSLWSPVGVSLAASFQTTVWAEFLAGANAMDRHVLSTPVHQNVPILSALISFWNLNFLKMQARAIIPYAARFSLLPIWVQQLVMESNGKTVKTNGDKVDFLAAPVIFGDVGTNAQHAFFQALHQGANPAPVDFIGIIKDSENQPDQHQTLLANMLGQASALMTGKSDSTYPEMNFPGDRPSTTILLADLSPYALGALLAFYEHETIILAHLCGINPFDQWGVELGKQLAGKVKARMSGTSNKLEDAATEHLINIINKRSAPK